MQRSRTDPDGLGTWPPRRVSQSRAGLGGNPLTNGGRGQADGPEEVLLAAEDGAMHFPVRGGLLRTVPGQVLAGGGGFLHSRGGEEVSGGGENRSGEGDLPPPLP